MTDHQLKLCDEIIAAGKTLHSGGYVVSNDGNLSALCGEGEIIITPSGVSKGSLSREIMLRVDFDGRVLEGGKKPSVETPMHLAIYKSNKDARAVVHAHPYTATLCSIFGLALDLPVLAETVLGVGMIPLAPFAEPSTQALADSVVPFTERYSGCLMANHGCVTWADSVEKALYQMEQIEFYAKITLGILTQDKLEPKLLSRQQIENLLEIRKGIAGMRPLRIPEGGAETVNTEALYPRGRDSEI